MNARQPRWNVTVPIQAGARLILTLAAALGVSPIASGIVEGAAWPVGALKGNDGAVRHWAFQPAREPKIRDLPGSDSDHPIDRFILRQQLRRGTRAVELANRRTLIRRATFDLTGLPPTPEEVEAFAGDDRPDAFERLLDRLLASPRYGECWGRHWLDLVRYADTAGDDSDYPIPQAGLYRDYVIDASNSDKPYDEFLREQLAGDILARQGPSERFRERVIASGYIAQSKRFATRKHEDMHLIIEDTLNTTGQVMLGLTLRCARCHDHKYDPTTMEDYYALYGFFQSTVYPHPGSEEQRQPSDLVPLVPDAELAEREAAYQREHAGRIKELEGEIERIEKETPDKDERRKGTASLRESLEQLRQGSPLVTAPMAYAVKEGEPADAAFQTGGDPNRKGRKIPRGVPRFLHPEGLLEIPGGQSGRLELARWIASGDNPLTARVMVNRIWQYHFGKGLVSTPSNFGLQSEAPSHPELLDWLALRFVESGWSIKAMHRLIMLSETWRRASLSESTNAEIDPANATYWRFDRRRLDAEAIRDSMMGLAGALDFARPGPHPFPEVKKWTFTAHHQFKAVYPSNHRSVYLMVQRLHPHPYLSLFNGPDTTASTPIRDASTVPLQALYMSNSTFIQEQARGLAARLIAHSSDGGERVERAYRLLFARPPSGTETGRALRYVAGYGRLLAEEEGGNEQTELEAWTSLSRVLLASNEFVYVD